VKQDTLKAYTTLKPHAARSSLDSLRKALAIAFTLGQEAAEAYYCVHVHEPFETKKKNAGGGGSRRGGFGGGGRRRDGKQMRVDSQIRAQGRTLSFWCFSPGVAMRSILKLGVS